MRHRPPTAPSLLPLEERLVPFSGLANPDLYLVLPAQLAKAYGVEDMRFTNPAGGEAVAFTHAAVPQTGTLLLGSIAATLSGCGIWRNRRKKPSPLPAN